MGINCMMPKPGDWLKNTKNNRGSETISNKK